MFLIRNGHAAVLLLTFTRILGFASGDHEKTYTDDSTEIVARYLRLPWIEGLQWLNNSSESSGGQRVKEFILGVESGELWALKKFETLLKDQSKFREKNKSNLGTSNIGKIDIQDEDSIVRAGTVFQRTTSDIGSGGSQLSSLAYNLSSSDKTQNNQSVNDETTSSPMVSKDLTIAEISVIVLFSTIAAALIGCTICDCMERYTSAKSSTTVNMLSKFSLITSTQTLFKGRSNPDLWPAIDGIRCLCCISIMIGHRYLIMVFVMRKEITLLNLLEEKSTWFGLYLLMTTLAVDTFGVISGFLAAYLFLKAWKSGKGDNLLKMYVYRYVRLTPCLIVILLIVTVLLPRFGSGPDWEASSAAVVNPCRENWLLNVLYVQNVVNSERICLLHTWYLALDMQVFWIYPLLLFPLYRWPKFGLGVLGLILGASVITPVIVLARAGYATTVLRFGMDWSWHLDNVATHYLGTYNRASPFLIGILLGYDVATRRRRLSQVTVTRNWTVAGVLVLFCAWALNHGYQSSYVYDLKMEIISAALVRPAWSIASAWVIYACTQGYGGLATRFLSLPIFLPVSRLSYGIYLVHPLIEVITVTSSPGSVQFVSLDKFIAFCIDFIVSIAMAIVLNIFTEAPAIVLTKILRDKHKRQPETDFLDQKSKKEL